MFARRKYDRLRYGKLQAKYVLGVVADTGRVAVAPALIDGVAVFDAPWRQRELAGIEAGFLADFADRGLLQGFAGLLRTGDRLPESRRVGALIMNS